MDNSSMESVSLLSSDVVEERLQAVRILADQGSVHMEQFCQAFGDQDWRVRKEAVRVFLALPNVDRFTSDIIKLLQDSENAGLRNSSIEILVSLGPLVVSDLTATISCPDPEVRKFVIDILGEIGVSGCEEGVLSALSDEDTNVRYAAVETLGKLAVDGAVAPLLDLMDTADTGLRFTILEALASIGKDVPVDRLSRFLDDRVLRKALFDCLGRIGGKDVLPYLVEGLVDPMRKVREASLGSLGKLVPALHDEVKVALRDAPENLPTQLIEMLSAPDIDTQRAVIRLLSMVGGLQAAQALLPLLEDDKLREDVVAAFRTQEKLFYDQLLTKDFESELMTRLFLVYLAGELCNPTCLPLAMDSLASPEPQLRYTAVMTLGKIGRETSIEAVAACLKDESPDICDAAASALQMFDEKYCDAIASAVNPLMDSPDAALRMRAVRVLGSAKGSNVESALLMALKDFESEVRCEAIKALRGCSAEAYVEGLKLALNDEVVAVRRLAAESLGDCAGEQILPALSLVVDDPDPWVRAAAVRSLRILPIEQAEQLLVQVIQDPVGLVVIAALETLTERDFPKAHPYLEKALAHADEEVVRAAIDLLAREGQCDCLKTYGPELLNHSNPDVRAHIVQTMVRLCGKDCQPHLQQRLQIEEEPLVRQVLEETLHFLQRSGS